MSNNYFEFKQFIVHQEDTAMKVGVDAVILGAWANTENAKSILDIGTGTGLLGLMLAQKSEAAIKAIDIDYEAYKQAEKNIAASPWTDRVDVQNISLQEFSKEKENCFDLIICNPPYFTNSQKSLNAKRNLARHEDSLPLEVLFACTATLLNEKGRFILVYPFEKLNDLTKEASISLLYENKKMIIKGNENKAPNRVVIEFSKQSKTITTEELVVRNSATNDYSHEYKILTKDYYLNF